MEGGGCAAGTDGRSFKNIIFRRYGLMKRGLKGFAFLVSGLVLGIIGTSISGLLLLCLLLLCIAF